VLAYGVIELLASAGEETNTFILFFYLGPVAPTILIFKQRLQ